MDVDIKACMDEIMFGGPEKPHRVRRTNCTKKTQQCFNSVQVPEKVSSCNDITGPKPKASLEKQALLWMENSFMRKDTIISENRCNSTSMSKIGSQKYLIDKLSGAISTDIRSVKRNCNTQIKHPNTSYLKQDTELFAAQCVDSHSGIKKHAIKRSSTDFLHIDTSKSCDSFNDQVSSGCKRGKSNEVDSNGLSESFNDSSSFLQSIDFDFLDACVNMNLHAKPSVTSTSSVLHNIQVTSESNEGSSCPDSDEVVAKCRTVAGPEATQLVPVKCGPTNRQHETAGMENNAVTKDVTVARQNYVTETKIIAKSETNISDGFLNILQVIDAADSIPLHRSDTDVKLLECASAHSESADISLGAEKKSAVVTPVLGANRRMSMFASRIRKTLAANARLDTPVRIRPPACSFEKGVLEDMGVESEKGCSSNPEDTFYGLPLKVQQLFKEQRSISELYEWQKECLTLRAICDGTNLIYSLPTSGGKTLVAEVLILRQLLCLQKDAILILPFVAIVQEKVRGLSSFAVELDFAVEEYAASKGQIPPRQKRARHSLYVATIEKASSLINSLIENKRMNSVGLVVVDELHMLGEGGSRGAILETTLTKVMHSSVSTQIVGMSATLSNVKDIQKFLNAEIYSSNFRPVELKEYVKVADTIYEVDSAALDPDDLFQFSRVIAFKYDREMNAVDPDQLAGLILEVIPNNSCLVFCPTKKNCENVAQLLCKMIPKEMCNIRSQERRTLYESLKLEGSGAICPVLRVTIPLGIAYHHSGLTSDERKLIEEAYLEGTLCVLCCTSTLAAGVNLPARRVILRSPYVGKNFISKSQYKQMTGRAGRAGIDASGESILIINAVDKLKLPDLIGGSYDRCLSSLLYEGNKGMRSLLLSTIGLKITPTTNDLLMFVKRTLCHVQSELLNVNMVEITKNALQQLIEAGLVLQRKADGKAVAKSCKDMTLDSFLDVTNLGRAVFKGSIDVDFGTKLYGDLSSAQQSIVLANYLHLLYLVTPYDMVNVAQPCHWMNYLRELGSLTASELKVATLVGVTEGHVAKKASGQRSRQVVDEFAVNRFYLTLMLYNLWKQRTVWDVSERFQVSRGFVQQLLTGAASFGACVSHFCQELEEFWGYQDLMSNFVKKLSFCCSMELVPLLEIPGIKMGRARQLQRAGFRSLQHIAYANPQDLVKQIEHMPYSVAKQIVSSAQMLLTEKAEALMEEAENMIALPDSST